MRSSAVASPWMSTAPGSAIPLPIGSENSRLTFELRRMLNAFCGRPMLVASKNRPSVTSLGVTGQVCGEPSRDSVVNSHVKYLSMMSSALDDTSEA